MFDDVRIKTMHPKEDEVRWCLAGTEAYRCHRCGFQCTATFSGCPVEEEPILVCAVCLSRCGKHTKLRLVTGPERDN